MSLPMASDGPGLGIVGAGEISALIDREISDFEPESEAECGTLDAFIAARCAPHLITVNFSGGITQKCWAVTRSDGAYRVVYLPLAGYFSLCVDSDFGPLDIGVHGPAIACYGSV